MPDPHRPPPDQTPPGPSGATIPPGPSGATISPGPSGATISPGPSGATGFAGGLGGFLGPRTVLGWAADPLAPAAPVTLRLRLRGEAIGALATGTHDRPEFFPDTDPRHGFLLDLPEGYQPGDLATGRLALHPLRDGAEHPALPAGPRLLAQEQALAGHAMLARAEAMLGAEELAAMLAMLGRAQGFGPAPVADAENAALARALRGGRPRDAALAPLLLPVGTRSADGAVTLGREGQLFLLGGSNGSLARLGAEPAQRDRLVAAWLELIAARQARARALGIRYAQLIVPETASLVPELLPDPAAGGPSPFLAALEAALARRPELAAVVVDGRAVLHAAAAAAEMPLSAMVRRIDSHPSAAGIHALAQAVLDRFGERAPDFGHRFNRAMLTGGDLGGKFAPLAPLEEIQLAPSRAFARFGAEPALVAEHLPEDGGHIGRTEHWRAPGAPSPRRLMAFGNSVCGTVRAGQGLLSGWLARCFAEYRFHWHPAVDWDAVEAARPELLLCQTVERFMARVPEA